MLDLPSRSPFSWSIAVFSSETIRSIFQRTGILHLFGALKVRITQTKYSRSEVGVEIMHLSSQTQGSISPPGHTATDSPLCPTFHSTYVAIFKMTLLTAEANDNPQVWYSLSLHTLLWFILVCSMPRQSTSFFLKICSPEHIIWDHFSIFHRAETSSEYTLGKWEHIYSDGHLLFMTVARPAFYFIFLTTLLFHLLRVKKKKISVKEIKLFYWPQLLLSRHWRHVALLPFSVGAA